MFIPEALIAAIVSLVLSGLFVLVTRRGGRRTGLLWLFLILFLASWAGGVWLKPFGPTDGIPIGYERKARAGCLSAGRAVPLLGREIAEQLDFSEETARIMDEERHSNPAARRSASSSRVDGGKYQVNFNSPRITKPIVRHNPIILVSLCLGGKIPG
jgi:hypothetical protein